MRRQRYNIDKFFDAVYQIFQE
jgi:hypothetical protein